MSSQRTSSPTLKVKRRWSTGISEEMSPTKSFCPEQRQLMEASLTFDTSSFDNMQAWLQKQQQNTNNNITTPQLQELLAQQHNNNNENGINLATADAAKPAAVVDGVAEIDTPPMSELLCAPPAHPTVSFESDEASPAIPAPTAEEVVTTAAADDDQIDYAALFDTIDAEAEAEHNQNQQTLKSVVEHLEGVCGDLALDFHYPVPESVAGYYRLITHPMCFQDIYAKIDADAYTDVADVRRDVQLVFSNCLTFNAPDTVYYITALKMKAVFESTWARLKLEPSYTPAAPVAAPAPAPVVDEDGYAEVDAAGFCKGIITELLNACGSDTIAQSFYEPVDKDAYPHYYGVIKQPICFEDIITKAEAGKYESVEQFHADVSLLLANCATFNDGRNAWGKAGKAMQRVLDAKWEANDYPKSTPPVAAAPVVQPKRRPGRPRKDSTAAVATTATATVVVAPPAITKAPALARQQSATYYQPPTRYQQTELYKDLNKAHDAEALCMEAVKHVLVAGGVNVVVANGQIELDIENMPPAAFYPLVDLVKESLRAYEQRTRGFVMEGESDYDSKEEED